MSTMALRSVLARYREAIGDEPLPGQVEALSGAQEELNAIEQACVALAAENIGDMVYDVRSREMLGWDGPRVTSWGNASQVINAVAKDVKP